MLRQFLVFNLLQVLLVTGAFSDHNSWLKGPKWSSTLSGEVDGKLNTTQSSNSTQRMNNMVPVIFVVNQDGTGDFEKVQDAVDAVPTYNTQRVVIRIYSGTYQEKVHIPSSKPFITLSGEGRTPPIISWNDTAAHVGSTWQSSTISIDAANFIARWVTFENTAPSPAPGVVGAQAIALRIGGDMAAFYDCKFVGAQDTLCDWRGRHYFKDCFIQGSIDFIFGDGQSFYEGCIIHSVARSFGAITAHYRQNNDEGSGFSFMKCIITGTGSILLGRAWGPSSRVVFSSTFMDSVIDPIGWGDWGNRTNDRSVYYGEFNNFGPGSNLLGRAQFSRPLTQVEAQPFLSIGWIDGFDWIDQSKK